MAGDEAGKVKISCDDAKRLLVDEAPAPMDVLMRDPAELIRRYPREAVALAAGLGIVLAASPRIRKGVIEAAVSVASVFLK